MCIPEENFSYCRKLGLVHSFPRYSLLLPSFHSTFLCEQAKCLISGSSEPRTMPEHMKAFKEGKDESMGKLKNSC